MIVDPNRAFQLALGGLVQNLSGLPGPVRFNVNADALAAARGALGWTQEQASDVSGIELDFVERSELASPDDVAGLRPLAGQEYLVWCRQVLAITYATGGVV